MQPANNENNDRDSGPPPVRAAMIADNQSAADLAAAIRATDRFDLVAQAGMDRPAAIDKVEWFDDVRAPIAQSRVEAVIVAGSTRRAVEVGALACEHGVHIWRMPPLGRDFAETLEVVRGGRSAGVMLRTYSWAEHVLDDSVTSVTQRRGYAELCVRAAGPPPGHWRCSKQEAGGGVLALDGYAWLELAYRLYGLPEWTQCALSYARGASVPPTRETEEVAVAILRYPSGAMVHAHASWDIPPHEAFWASHGEQASVRITPERATILNLDGEPIDDNELPDQPIVLDLIQFAEHLRSDQRPEQLAHAAESHIAVAAIIEAAYLSSRTGELESPAKLYEVHRWPQPAA